MCLCRKEGENLRIAEEDITVYKIIEKKPAFYITDEHDQLRLSYHYVTPFMLEEVSIDLETVIESDSPMSRAEAEWLSQEGYRYFGAGLIHAYIDRNFLTREREGISRDLLMPMHSLVEVECVIPKGEFYILGEKGDVAASKLIVKKIVDNSKEK